MTYSNGPNLLIPYILPSLTKQSELLCQFFVHFTASPASWYFWTGLQTGMTELFVWSVCLSLSAWLLQRSTNTDNAKQYCTVMMWTCHKDVDIVTWCFAPSQPVWLCQGEDVDVVTDRDCAQSGNYNGTVQMNLNLRNYPKNKNKACHICLWLTKW